MTTIAKRISVGEMLGNMKERRQIAEQYNGQPVVRIVGMAFASTVQDKEDDNGNIKRNVKFKGSAKATNLITGNVVTSTNTFLPGAASDILEEALAQGEKGTVVKYAFDISLVEDVSSAVGYVYEVKSLIEPDEKNDPFAALEKGLPKTKPQPMLENKAEAKA